MRHLSLTDRLREALTGACEAIDAWNQEVYAARARDEATGRPGHDEFAIMTDREHIDMRLARSHGVHRLDLLEDAVRCCGWAPQDLYAALGRPRPQVEPEGPHVVDWFQGHR